jgi:hypothetical protein
MKGGGRDGWNPIEWEGREAAPLRALLFIIINHCQKAFIIVQASSKFQFYDIFSRIPINPCASIFLQIGFCHKMIQSVKLEIIMG